MAICGICWNLPPEDHRENNDMPQTTEIHIRPMQKEERRKVHAIMRQAFPLIQQWFFSWTPHVLVAEQEGKLLGGIVLKLFKLPRGRKGGLVAWIFTAPEARGLGAGQRLAEAGIDFFEQHACDEIFACVEGYNTSSSALFATRGFSILSPGEQFRRYGLGTFAVWFKTFHFMDVGHFLWARPAAQTADSPALQWWGTVAANILLGLFVLWRANGFNIANSAMWLILPLVILALFGVRYLGMWLAARRQGLAVRFRAWESGFPLSLGIALAFGSLLLMPGNVYPAAGQPRYRDLLPRLGRAALAGTLPVLLVVWAAWGALRLNLPAGLEAWLAALRQVGTILAVFDIALPFFPFTSLNGRRLWDWNKAVWALLALAVIGLILV
jgi:L-amino acid N-acyltransferase YncA